MNKSYAEIIADEYLKPFYAFSVSRTSNAHEAEELSQEITYQVIKSVCKYEKSINDFNKYVWSAAHNTYKRWLSAKKRAFVSTDDEDFFGTIVSDENIEQSFIEKDTISRLYREISILSDLYRRVLVMYYYDEMKSSEIAERLGISSEMVRFYLMKGKQKIREGIEMSREFGEKSFNPSSLSVYYMGIDYTTINIWTVFKKKLPQNIALAAYEKPVSTEELCIETGVPAVYLEEEIEYLLTTGLLKEPVKGKYQSAFFILKKSLFEQVVSQIREYADECADKAIQLIEHVIPKMKEMNLFQVNDISDMRYRYLFMQTQNVFEVSDNSEEADPVILSDGSRGFIWGIERDGVATGEWGSGCSHVVTDKYHLFPVDYVKLGYRHQSNFNKYGHPEICEAMYQIASENLDDKYKTEYAELIEMGYAKKAGNTVLSNIPVMSETKYQVLKDLYSKAAKELAIDLDYSNLNIMVERVIKANFSNLVQGSIQKYRELILSLDFDSFFCEALYKKGYITVPEENDNTPMTSYIILK